MKLLGTHAPNNFIGAVPPTGDHTLPGRWELFKKCTIRARLTIQDAPYKRKDEYVISRQKQTKNFLEMALSLLLGSNSTTTLYLKFQTLHKDDHPEPNPFPLSQYNGRP